MNLGTNELLIILAIVLLIFGGSQLPKLARSLGHAQREFKGGAVESDPTRDTSSGTTRSVEPTSEGDGAA